MSNDGGDKAEFERALQRAGECVDMYDEGCV